MRLLIVLSALSAIAVARPTYEHESNVHHYAPYSGPLAPLGHDGRVVDTPEVAHAKAAHFHAYSEELSKISHLGPALHHHEPEHHEPEHQEPAYHQEVLVQHEPAVGHHAAAAPVLQHVYQHESEPLQLYHGPPAPLAHDGRVIDTPEVAHAKAAHFNAYAEELSKAVHRAPAYHQGWTSY